MSPIEVTDTMLAAFADLQIGEKAALYQCVILKRDPAVVSVDLDLSILEVRQLVDSAKKKISESIRKSLLAEKKKAPVTPVRIKGAPKDNPDKKNVEGDVDFITDQQISEWARKILNL